MDPEAKSRVASNLYRSQKLAPEGRMLHSKQLPCIQPDIRFLLFFSFPFFGLRLISSESNFHISTHGNHAWFDAVSEGGDAGAEASLFGCGVVIGLGVFSSWMETWCSNRMPFLALCIVQGQGR
jgi:hypothetical protein